MRILITADLHYDIARSRRPTEQLAQRAVAAGGDTLVLVGDTAGRDLQPLRECLRLFDGFVGRKLLVPGNHCLWCADQEDSIERYESLLPAAAAECGFAVLDHEPVVVGTVGLVGSVGWYDYSFRDHSLEMPLAFYRAKLTPGAAGRLDGYEDLLETHRDELTERHMSMGIRWMDGQHVRLPMADEAFADLLARRLADQLADVSARAERIVAFLHHVPFAEIVPAGGSERVAFAAAYMGAETMGRMLLRWPKLTDVYCGHSHWPTRRRIGSLNVINVGSTYVQKRLEVLDLPEAQCESDEMAYRSTEVEPQPHK
ncbi:MAG: metallophosphoesterase, partial [Planctomycetota bacterium]